MNNNQGRRRTRRVRQQRKQSKAQISRILLTICMMALVAVVSIGGTMAWLSDKSDEITNTFTTGNIDIALTETDTNLDNDNNAATNTYKMTPGVAITKDPTVTYKADSEAGWLFVKVEEVNSASDYLNYKIGKASDTVNWTELTGLGDVEYKVYYIEQDATTADVSYSVIEGNTVTVKDTITNTEMDTAETSVPQIKITAYAIQKEKFASAADAWTEAQNAIAYNPN